MASDPAFLFYPGDYLRDILCLSEKSHVVYDRIMCEHMRNTCEDVSKITVSKETVNFLSRHLNDDEKSELFNVIIKIGQDFQIRWVAESISKRRAYTESRRKNKQGKSKNISKSHDQHVENVNENEIVNRNDLKARKEKTTSLSGSGFHSDAFEKNIKLTDLQIGATIQYINLKTKVALTSSEIEEQWEAFKIIQLSKHHWYDSYEDLLSHFRNSLKIEKQKNGTTKQNKSSKGFDSAKTAGIESAITAAIQNQNNF